jgi:hypothetical protein
VTDFTEEELDRAQARANHDLTPEQMREELTKLLGLEQISRTVIGAEVFGRGVAASVDLHLSGDLKVTFDRFGDIGKPAALTAHLMTTLGVEQTLKGPQAIHAGSLIFRLARHHGEEDADAIAREWGVEFLRLAPVGEVDLQDQASRWRAFSRLAQLSPQRDAGEDRSAHSLACAAVVLEATNGVRLVRSGWFLAYVRREVGGMDPGALATRMERVGWRRQGAEGWIKATCPDDPRRTLRWRFYNAPEGWEER